MKSILIVLLLISLSCSSIKKISPAYVSNNIETNVLSNIQSELITNTINNFPNHSEFAIAVVENDKVKFYGLKRENDTLQKSENAESFFEIGSLTKVFTAHLLLNLINNGQIKSINEPINPYLDFKIKGEPEISFLQLANHTSGLPGDLNVNIFSTDISNPYKNYNKEKFVNFLSEKVELESKPGEKYQYSNVGVALLGYTLRQITSKDYESLLQGEIFKLIGMDNSTSIRNKLNGKLVSGFNWKGKPTPYWDLAEMNGAGAILSNVSELSKYAIWNFNALNKELSAMTKKTFSVTDNTDVSIGWHIIKNKTKKEFLWHNGGTGGFKSSMGINPYNKTSVIVLTNVGATNNPKKGLIDKLCFDLMKSIEKE